MSDAANILKSVLARGEVKVIGATTLSEYKEHILEDEALRTALPLRARGIIKSQQGGVPRGLQHRDRAGNSP